MCYFPSVLFCLRGVQFLSSLSFSDSIILFGRDKYSHFTIKIDYTQFFFCLRVRKLDMISAMCFGNGRLLINPVIQIVFEHKTGL